MQNPSYRIGVLYGDYTILDCTISPFLSTGISVSSLVWLPDQGSEGFCWVSGSLLQWGGRNCGDGHDSDYNHQKTGSIATSGYPIPLHVWAKKDPRARWIPASWTWRRRARRNRCCRDHTATKPLSLQETAPKWHFSDLGMIIDVP